MSHLHLHHPPPKSSRLSHILKWTHPDQPKKHKKRLMLWVESHTGVGHMQIVSQLSRELCKKDFEVMIVSGSFDMGQRFDFATATLVPLERLTGAHGRPRITTSRGTFDVGNIHTFMQYLDACEQQASRQLTSENVHFDGLTSEPGDHTITWKKAITDYLQGRQASLRHAFNTFKPDVVLTEFWPAGRPGSNVELIPFMQYIRCQQIRPLVVSLERDVLLTANTYNHSGEKILDNYRRFIDLVLIEGDGGVVRFDETFPMTPQIGKPLHYAGYFSPPMPEKNSSIDENQREVLVSAGGSFTPSNKEFYKAIILAKKHSAARDRTWRILVSNQCPQPVYQEMQSLGEREGQGSIIVERNRQDFQFLLVNASLSISRGGYNTTLEVAESKVPGIIVPEVADDYGLEQEFRAMRFEVKGFCKVVSLEDARKPESMAKKIDEMYLQSRTHKPCELITNGAANAVNLIEQHLKHRPMAIPTRV